jgi:hypothetical protein
MSDKRKNRKFRLSVMLESPEYDALIRLARKEDVTVANYVRRALGWPQEERGVLRDSTKDRMKTPKVVLKDPVGVGA